MTTILREMCAALRDIPAHLHMRAEVTRVRWRGWELQERDLMELLPHEDSPPYVRDRVRFWLAWADFIDALATSLDRSRRRPTP